MAQFARTAILLATHVLVQPQAVSNVFLATSSMRLLLLAKFAQEIASHVVAVVFVSLALRDLLKTMAHVEGVQFLVLTALLQTS